MFPRLLRGSPLIAGSGVCWAVVADGPCADWKGSCPGAGSVQHLAPGHFMMSCLESQRNRRVGTRLLAGSRFTGIGGSIPQRSRPSPTLTKAQSAP